jgi:ribosome biogenesis ATPase
MMQRRPRTTLRQGLDRDVYQIVRKLKDGAPSKDAKVKLTITSVYDAIKKSNSSLSRQKRRILEDSIERVLQFISEDSSDSSGIEDGPETPRKV